MIVAIHQPQYLPWLPFLDKADRCDVFVYLDHVQYQKNGVQNRNQIKTAAGPTWLTVPVTAGLDDKINTVKIATNPPWVRKHINSLQQNYAKAPAYALFEEELKPILEQPWTLLVELNIAVCEWMFRRFDIACRRVRASEIPVTGKATELVLNLCQNLGATRYLSGQGAKAYQTPEQFATAGIELTYQGYEGPVYPQLYPQTGFVPHLSAVDLLFNVGERAAEVLRSGQK